ncbi:MAG: type II toxin-antitoxin system Phd/YefM family antitoxin [Nitrospirae bacterium]|nr:type II toxin-antitoxin system Phd/YefM family antitoxin [Nitrospirota bacterium]
MAKTISATDVVRKFSDVLNSIKYKGNHFIILRGGKPVASITPVEKPIKEKTLGELKELLKKLPRLGDEAERFEKDLKAIIKHQPLMPEKD